MVTDYNQNPTYCFFDKTLLCLYYSHLEYRKKKNFAVSIIRLSQSYMRYRKAVRSILFILMKTSDYFLFLMFAFFFNFYMLIFLISSTSLSRLVFVKVHYSL